MLRRMLREGYRDQRGITGLETAIILIPFIMVAAVFAYVVLSAGLFSSQEAREAIYSGLERTRGTVEVRGSVLANMTEGVVDQLLFCVGSIGTGADIDFTDTSEGNNTVVNLLLRSVQPVPFGQLDAEQDHELEHGQYS